MMSKQYLQHIDDPRDLRRLSIEELEGVCDDLREFIIEELSNNPGHFASSLGVIELTVALHYVFNTPVDKLIWDVGHQAYAHKILTGRKARFHSNRKIDGISGFPSREESVYDAFGVGHASTSISAALGIAIGQSLNSKTRQTIAVIGDGSMTGGLAYEGLNNASINPNNLIIILNDNNMAIDNPVGGLSEYLVSLTTSKSYNRLRFKLYRMLNHKGRIAQNKGAFTRLSNSLKAFITKQNSLFEGLNIRYFGPVDGHDVEGLVKILSDLKEISGPKLLHIKSKKGKGYSFAEENASEWHAPGRFNKETGERISTKQENQPILYQEVFGKTLVELANKNSSIVGITPAMPSGCSMNYMFEKFPDRTFDVGIAESHAVTFSAGLATEGLVPFCNIYSSFMQRAFDQVIHDVALQKLQVVMCLDRAGLVGEDGATHHGVFDLAYFRCIPNLTITAPLNEHQLRNLMYTAQQPQKGAFVIRYPRGKGEIIDWRNPMQELPIGKGEVIKTGSKIVFLTLGEIGCRVQKVVDRLLTHSIDAAQYNMIFLKPIDEDLLFQAFRDFEIIITVEEGVLTGGFGSAIAEFAVDHGFTNKILRIGLPDHFSPHGDVNKLRERVGLSIEGIERQVLNFINKLHS